MKKCKYGKVGYKSFESAYDKLGELQTLGYSVTKAYECDSCGKFHVTSKPVFTSKEAALHGKKSVKVSSSIRVRKNA